MRPWVILAVLVAASGADVRTDAQEIAFTADLPRTLVFIQEDGTGSVAAGEFTAFLEEAGFPVIDPAFARRAVHGELVRAALDGDESAATELGRDFGAQLLILGTAAWGARPDPVDGSLVTATTEVSVRALRLDVGEVVARGSADARVVEATEQAARTLAVRKATQEMLTTSSFLGALLNDWDARPWSEVGYWKPDPGALPGGAALGEAPAHLTVLRTDVLPDTGASTRGIGVVRKGGGDLSAVRNTVRLEGVLSGEARSVTVDGHEAILEPLSDQDRAAFGLSGVSARRFVRTLDLPVSQDSVHIVASSSRGPVAEVVAAPRIDRRWAVVIGVGEYASPDIPDLRYARADAEAMRDFLLSDAAGPFDDVLYLVDADAGAGAMREALFVFLQQADWDDLVVVYFAGHGAPDPNRPDNLYLLPSDTDPDALASTAFPMWDVKTALRRQIAAERVLVIADACHSAGTADGAARAGGPANPIAGSFAELSAPSRRLMITAADTNEASLEDARWGGHGVFTHFLLRGLHGEGDADADGIVTFTELYGYVSSQVREATEGRQNPQMAGLGDIPLAVVPAPGR